MWGKSLGAFSFLFAPAQDSLTVKEMDEFSDAAAVTSQPRIESATLEDMPQLVELLSALFSVEEDFVPDPRKQEQGVRMILEQPSRGRIFVLRTDHMAVGMANLLFTISTAEGGFVVLLEDVIVHPEHRGQGYGGQLLDYVIQYAREKGFKRITLLTDRISAESQSFFQKRGFKFSSMIPMRLVYPENS
jgi:GNAT superfamily N-acetyltransferase